MSEPSAWGRSLSFWTRTNLIYLMAVTVTGALVRLTSSGLGCTDWPACEDASPVGEAGFHSIIEFGNRVVSGLAIIPVIGAWLALRHVRPDLQKWIWALVVGFLGQVVLGMLVTRTELDPRVVLGHFLLSIVLVWLAAGLESGVGRDPIGLDASAPRPKQAALARITLATTGLAITIGTLVTGSGPHTGSDESEVPVPRLGFEIREITRVHSVVVWVAVALMLWTLYQFKDSPRARRQLTIIAGVAVAQGGIGYLQYWSGVPEVLVAIHIAGAVTLWALLSLFTFEQAAESHLDATTTNGLIEARK